MGGPSRLDSWLIAQSPASTWRTYRTPIKYREDTNHRCRFTTKTEPSRGQVKRPRRLSAHR